MRRALRSILAVIAVPAAGLALTAALAPGLAGAATQYRCGNVAFARQSDDEAYEITAHSAGCPTARKVAAASRPSSFRSRQSSYSAEGFTCSGRPEQLGGAGKQVVRFQCTRGQSSVSFLRG